MEKNWSISLEHEEYENNVELIIEDALEAIQNTSVGYYVNIVTPANFGNPDDYLTKSLKLCFGPEIETKFIDQCGCGGYVLRVWKKQ